MDLMPFRVALAAQADGWWVRSVIIWSKPNAMPESTKDRPTTAHEYVLMLTKSGTPNYWYHPETGEMTTKHPSARTRGRWKEGVDWQYSDPKNGRRRRITLWRGVDYWWDQEAVREPSTSPEQEAHNQRYAKSYAAFDDRAAETGQPGNVNNVGIHSRPGPGGRNLRSVWEFPTAQTPEAHFATFPPELPRRCIEAATPREVCARCGIARVRLVESETRFEGGSGKAGTKPEDLGGKWGDARYGKNILLGPVVDTRTIGWSDCACSEPDYQPGIVLDPFAGVGTTLYVARQLGRRYIGIELSKTYAQMARTKLETWWAPGNLALRTAPAGQPRMEGL